MNGNMYNVILNLYKDAKSCVVYNNVNSDVFPCCNGVRQVENLSPFHFAVYLNDLESFLGTGNLKGLESISRDIEKQFDIYLNLFTLLYAGDTFLMAESPQELQNLLDSFDDYCSVWKLKVNAEKNKIMIFTNGRLPQNLKFSLHGLELEVVDNFTYLGITLSKTGNFNLTKKKISEKGTFFVLKPCMKF
jgi:hypothetical protein